MNYTRWAKKVVKKYSSRLGPGLTTGAADDDPSGITTYSQAGAQFGYGFLWLAPVTFPMMVIVQEMCARIGIVTGKGLAANIRERYSPAVLAMLCILLFIANTVNIAADLSAMVAAVQLLMPRMSTFVLMVFFTVGITLLEILLPYRLCARILKYLTLALFSYVFAAFSVNVDWTAVFTAIVIPEFSFSKEHMLMLCAVLGTTISPYLFFWQSAQEVEEHASSHTVAPSRHKVHTMIQRMRFDVWAGMAFSNIIMFFVMVTCATALNQHGVTNITSAATAAAALRPFAGDFAYALFALGIVATGLLAVPILAGSSAYAFAESFGWRRGLDMKFAEATAFYSIIVLSMLLGSLCMFLSIDPISLLFFAAVLNGLIAPIIIFYIVQVSAGLPRSRNSKMQTITGYTLVVLMGCVGYFAVAGLLY